MTHDQGCACLGCKLAYWRTNPLALGVGPRNTTPPRPADPAWERGRAGTHRADGTFMPYIGERTMNTIGLKEFAERRHELEPAIRANASHTSTTS